MSRIRCTILLLHTITDVVAIAGRAIFAIAAFFLFLHFANCYTPLMKVISTNYQCKHISISAPQQINEIMMPSHAQI